MAATVHPLAAYTAEASRLASAAAATLGHTGPLPTLESPPDPAMGDLGMPCFVLAKALRKAPNAIAADLAKAVGDPELVGTPSQFATVASLFVGPRPAPGSDAPPVHADVDKESVILFDAAYES